MNMLAMMVLAVALGGTLPAEETGPHFQEVLRLIRVHLPGVTEAELNRALVEGLLKEFQPRVMLVHPGARPPEEPAAGEITRTEVYGESVGYLRAESVAPGLSGNLVRAIAELSSSNTLGGLVIDLRFAGGTDYRAAFEAANLFTTEERPLLAWEEVVLRSAVVADPIRLPTVVLVNRQTEGAAEALAAAMRKGGPALLLGARTAGRARVWRSFPLEDGGELRIASGTVEVPGLGSISDGVEPDIELRLNLDVPEERRRMVEPWGEPDPATERSRARLNEAELVRQRNGEATDPGAAESAPPRPVLRDEALIRALDVLKGMMVTRRGAGR